MKNLLDMLTAEQIEKLKGLGIEEIKRHFSNPLYIKADEMAKQTRIDQIIKGAQKYPEPLNPASWSGKELVIHAFQENIDQQHYLVAMLEKFEEMEREIERLKQELEEAQSAANDAAKTAEQFMDDKHFYMDELKKLEKQYKREMEKMRQLTDFLIETFPDARNTGDHCIDAAIYIIKGLKAENEDLKKADKVMIVNVEGSAKSDYKTPEEIKETLEKMTRKFAEMEDLK